MESRAWLLFTKKLTGEASDAECRELNNLLSAHPHLHDELQAFESIWVSNPPEVEHHEAFDSLVTRMHKEGISFHLPGLQAENAERAKVVNLRRPGNIIAALLGVAAVVIMIVLFYPSSINTTKKAPAEVAKSNQVSTRPGSRTKIELPDGTQVWLNADSKLTYGNDFGVTSRDVTLSGEAYFDVVSNKKVPFYIHTSKIKIKVTGTAFNVRAYPNEARSETSLLRGKVEVTLNSSPDKTYYLKPKEKLVVSDAIMNPRTTLATTILEKQSPLAKPAQLPEVQKLVFDATDSIPVETAWVNNKLAFTDESFREVADKMERWYGIEIVFGAPGLEGIHFTGKFENESVFQALEAMQLTAKFSFSKADNTITILKSTK